MTYPQTNPLDILPELRSLLARQPPGSGDHNTLERAIAEVLALRGTATAAQDRGRVLLEEVRALRAAAQGRPTVPCMRLGAKDIPLPEYAHPGDVGMDLRADLTGELKIVTPTRAHLDRDPAARSIRLYPGARVIIPCGFAFAIPDDYEGQVRPRSSTSRGGTHAGAAGFFDGVWTALGSIDRGYRGPVGCTLWHLGDEPVTISHGQRVAQLVVSPVASARLVLVDALDETVRGAGGFGSTGSR